MSNKAPDAEFRELTGDELKDYLKKRVADHATNPPQAGREELPSPSRMENFERIVVTEGASGSTTQRAAEAKVRAFFGGGRPELAEK